MNTLMIVDDEELSRLALKTMISRSFNDITVVAEAESGPEAVEKYERFSPDAVIMDIRIPVFDGLETSRRILASHPDARILICSAYDNFPLVSQALDLGIKGYLLKPLNKTELIKKLEPLFLEKDSVTSMLAERQILNEMLIGDPSPETNTMLMQHYGCLPSGILVSFSTHSTGIKDIYPEIRTQIRSSIPSVSRVICGVIGRRIAGFIFPSDSSGITERALQNAADILRKKWADLTVDYLPSEPGEWAATWIELGKKTLGSPKTDLSFPTEELIRKFKGGCSLTETVDEWAGRFEGLDTDSFRAEALQLVCEVRYQLMREGITLGPEILSSFLRQAQETDNRDELIMTMKYTLRGMEQLRKKKKEALSPSIRNIYSYLTDDRLKSLSLDSLAADMQLSPQYLSRIFKEETGVNFITYVTQLRMEYAARLLRTTDKSVQDIMDECGYYDLVYFKKMFKKEFGISPSDFRRSVEESYD